MKTARFIVPDFRGFEKIMQGRTVEHAPTMISGLRPVQRGAPGGQHQGDRERPRHRPAAGPDCASRGGGPGRMDQQPRPRLLLPVVSRFRRRARRDLRAGAHAARSHERGLRTARSRPADRGCSAAGPSIRSHSGSGDSSSLPPSRTSTKRGARRPRWGTGPFDCSRPRLRLRCRRAGSLRRPISRSTSWSSRTEPARLRSRSSTVRGGAFFPSRRAPSKRTSSRCAPHGRSASPLSRHIRIPRRHHLVGPLSRSFRGDGFAADPEIARSASPPASGKTGGSPSRPSTSAASPRSSGRRSGFSAAGRRGRAEHHFAEGDLEGSGQGIGVIEAPRGFLVHSYLVDRGRIERVRLLVATQFNNAFINLLLHDLAARHVEGSACRPKGSG